MILLRDLFCPCCCLAAQIEEWLEYVREETQNRVEKFRVRRQESSKKVMQGFAVGVVRLGHTKLFLCFASPRAYLFKSLTRKKETRRSNRWLSLWRTSSSQYGRSEVFTDFSIILHSRRWYVEDASDENIYFCKPYGRACSPSERRFQASRTSRFSTIVIGAEFHSTHVKVQKEPSMKSVIVSLQPSLPALLWRLVVVLDM